MRGRSSGDASQPGSKAQLAAAFDPEPYSTGGHHRAPSSLGQWSQSTELEDAEQSLKEPQPPMRVHTNLFGILASSATFNDMDLTGFGGHRDTLAMLTLRRVQHSIDLPIEVFSHIVQYLDFPTYKSVRLACRSWSAAFTHVRPLHLPPICAVPAEILKDIYSYLSPTDMNAARHTCRKWMVASLEYRLLARVMEQAGFSVAAKADTTRNEKLNHPIGGEWRLSKRLATECSLSTAWSGNGFPAVSTGSLTLPITLHGETPASRDQGATSLELSGTIDFAGLSRPRLHGHDQRSSLRFVASTCGKILLVIDSNLIHVYCIKDLASSIPRYQHGGHIDFLVAIACPHHILAVSMDTSRDRYTIAAMLEDRIGLVMDVPELSSMARRSGLSSPHSERDTYNMTEAWDPKDSPSATPTTSQRRNLPPAYTDIYHTSPIARTPTYQQPSPLPVQFVPHVMYRNLCSKTSPPLSVAICPHRRCVAFGSSAGIELHWQDARTCQEISRWMELVGPAECIHFLPLRPQDEQDVAKKLRLTSSRVGPTYYHDPVSLNEAWVYEHCKFLRAVPLSDGKHLLYSEPATGDLCLGTGLHLPFGRPKPVKKFILEGAAVLFRERTTWPACYRAGTELSWGARVVAGFGQEIWLFSIPPDYLLDDTEMNPSLNESTYRKTEDGTSVIKGVMIGEVRDLVELAVDDSNGDVTVHAFSSSAPARVFQIRRYPSRGIKKRFIASDGRVLGDKDGNENLLSKGYVPRAETYQETMHPDHEVQDTAYRRLDGRDLAIDKHSAGVDDEIEMKDHAVGDWIHDRAETAGQDDEGYETDMEGVGRAAEWGWNDASADREYEELDRSRVAEWDVMELVRLEVEVLCGG